ncbi:MAG: hypothetical protein MSA89_07600 [Clostridium sp.]|nr:hypothetical protein [Clostridium sp.]
MFKANTIEQYKILKFIEKNFVIEDVLLKAIDKNTIKLIDVNNDSLYFTLDNAGNVIYRDEI